jgi:hypothetical protein
MYTPPPEFPSSTAAAPAPKTSGMAVTALVLGILSVIGFVFLVIPTILAIVLGHIAYSKIKAAPHALKGQGMAMAGFILGYLSLAVVPIVGLLAAMAIPAFQKVREQSQHKAMLNNARQLGAAAQQHFLDQGVTQVEFSIEPSTGAVQGPLAVYVPQLMIGSYAVDGVIEAEGSFSIAHEVIGKGEPYVFSVDGMQIGGPQPIRASSR